MNNRDILLVGALLIAIGFLGCIPSIALYFMIR